MIPIRCFTCTKVVGNLWEPFKQKLQDDRSPNEALYELGLTRYCCRRMLISHLDLTDKFLMYNCPSYTTDANDSSPVDERVEKSGPVNIQQQILRVASRHL